MNAKMNHPKEKTQYHHGDLRSSLLTAAQRLLKEQGIEGLSLRKLGEEVGVSRTAPYHHFKNKNELLCAVAADGFVMWDEQVVIDKNFHNDLASQELRFRSFVQSYVRFAYENPNLYDLMFGRPIWRERNYNTRSLKEKAYPSFQSVRDIVKNWQTLGLLSPEENPLRLTQVLWSTLHGIARLVIDGIYITGESSNKLSRQVDEMCECATRMFLQHSKRQS